MTRIFWTEMEEAPTQLLTWIDWTSRKYRARVGPNGQWTIEKPTTDPETFTPIAKGKEKTVKLAQRKVEIRALKLP